MTIRGGGFVNLSKRNETDASKNEYVIKRHRWVLNEFQNVIENRKRSTTTLSRYLGASLFISDISFDEIKNKIAVRRRFAVATSETVFS